MARHAPEQTKEMTRMDTIRITVEAEPIPQARSRFSGRHAYQPARSRAYREVVRTAAVDAMHGRDMMTGALSAQIEVYRRFKPTARNFGDADNHAKAILDALNGICFTDDAQVVKLEVSKRTDKVKPRAVVEISTVEQPPVSFPQRRSRK